MKKNLIKLISIFVICLLFVSAFGQRRGSFGHGSMGGGRPSFSRSVGSFHSSGSFGNSGVVRTRSFNTTRTFNRPIITRSNSFSGYRSNYRVGFRPSLSVHYYGNPYLWHGSHLYWYGNGYYSLFPGGPLLLGNSLMPGYNSAYGYNPYATSTMGYGGQTVIVNHSNGFFWSWIIGFFGVLVVVLVFFGIIRLLA